VGEAAPREPGGTEIIHPKATHAWSPAGDRVIAECDGRIGSQHRFPGVREAGLGAIAATRPPKELASDHRLRDVLLIGGGLLFMFHEETASRTVGLLTSVAGGFERGASSSAGCWVRRRNRAQ